MADWMVGIVECSCSSVLESLGASGSWLERSVKMIFTNCSLSMALNALDVAVGCVADEDRASTADMAGPSDRRRARCGIASRDRVEHETNRLGSARIHAGIDSRAGQRRQRIEMFGAPRLRGRAL